MENTRGMGERKAGGLGWDIILCAAEFHTLTEGDI